MSSVLETLQRQRVGATPHAIRFDPSHPILNAQLRGPARLARPHLLEQPAPHAVRDVLRAVARLLHRERDGLEDRDVDAVALDDAAAADQLEAAAVDRAAKDLVGRSQGL